jgi:hypothetical protein
MFIIKFNLLINKLEIHNYFFEYKIVERVTGKYKLISSCTENKRSIQFQGIKLVTKIII